MVNNLFVLFSYLHEHSAPLIRHVVMESGINGMDSYYLKLKCISKRVVSWYQGLVQVRKGQLADNCNHNINIGVGPLILLYLFQM